jgi:hypothetical protein
MQQIPGRQPVVPAFEKPNMRRRVAPAQTISPDAERGNQVEMLACRFARPIADGPATASGAISSNRKHQALTPRVCTAR